MDDALQISFNHRKLAISFFKLLPLHVSTLLLRLLMGQGPHQQPPVSRARIFAVPGKFVPGSMSLMVLGSALNLGSAQEPRHSINFGPLS